MFYNIIGESGSGKTTFLIDSLAKHKQNSCIIIVPEQQALDTERLLSAHLGDGYNMFCEVLNFERLCDRVFREYGGLAAQYLEGGGRGILMSCALEKLSGSLKQYRGVSGGADYVSKMLSAITSFRRAAMDAEAVARLATMPELVQSEGVLADKLSDISEIMRIYSSLCGDLSDPLDKPERMLSLAKTHRFFEGKVVFIDSYYTFTEQEHEIIALILNQCADAYITFCMPEEAAKNKSTHFANIAATYRRILKHQANGKIENIFLKNNHRVKRPELAFLSENIWNPAVKAAYLPKSEDECERAINIYECEGVFAEVSAAAAEVKMLVRKNGWRYKDIGIATRDTDSYLAVVESVFSKYEIPVFLSVKEDISTKPLLSLVFAAVECARTDFAPQSVKQYIKSSFSGLTSEECDYLSNYIDVWKIRGKSRYKGIDWQMNPDGYRESLSPYAKRILSVVAAAKQKLCDSLVVFAEEISAGATAAECAKAIFALIGDIGAEKRLVKLMEQARQDGDEERVLELSQLWDIVVSILEQLYITAGDEKLNPKRLLELLRIVAAEYSTGKLPTASDAVTVGDARLARFGDIKCLIVLGVNEGVFPSADKSGELFARQELKALERVGFSAMMSPEMRLAQEQFLFYMTISAPSERLSVYYSSASSSGGVMKASVAVSRILALFPDINIIRPSADKSRFIESAATAADYLAHLPDEVKALIPITTIGGITDFEGIVDGEFLDKITLSPSVIQRYSLCPFMFYSNYVLRLRENRTAAFDSAEVGTFLHKLLEVFLRTHLGKYDSVDRKSIPAKLRSIADEFIGILSNDSEDVQNKRLAFSINRLSELATIFVEDILDEFSQSQFQPIAFEQRLGSDGAPGGVITLDGGEKLYIGGVADRIDAAIIGDKQYIRVVDYKSGAQSFTPVEPVHGLALQMFLYLYAWCADGKSEPAGVLYMPVKPPKFDDKKSDYNKIARTGVVLNNMDVILAMEQEPSKKYIPVELKKSNEVSKRSSVATEEQMGHMFEFLKSKLSEVSGCIKSGKVDVNPLVINGGDAPCKYCSYIQICRNTRKRRQRVEKITTDQAREILFGKDENGGGDGEQ